ncbi:MAG: DedA family protein [Dehalococcoidia bacterium]|nr:DedA family protein [Dehalococcoidia bacterium]
MGSLSLENSIIEWITKVLETIDYLGVFILMILDPTALPVPAEIILPLAGWILADNISQVFLLSLIATIGSTIGCLFEFYLAKAVGRKFIIKYGKYLFISEEDLMKQEKFFVKNQFYFIFITRMIPFIPKTITSVISGIYNLNFYKYVAYTFIASYPTLFIYVYIGNNLGENYSEIKNYVGGFGFPILIILIIVIIGYFLFKYFKIKQNQ